MATVDYISNNLVEQNVSRPVSAKVALSNGNSNLKLHPSSAKKAGKSVSMLSPLEAIRGNYQSKLRSKVDTVRRISMGAAAFNTKPALLINTNMSKVSAPGSVYDAGEPSGADSKNGNDLLHSPGKLRQFFAQVRLEQSIGSASSPSSNSSTIHFKEYTSVQQKYRMMKARALSVQAHQGGGQFDPIKMKTSSSTATIQSTFSEIAPTHGRFASSTNEVGGGRRRSTTAPPGSTLAFATAPSSLPALVNLQQSFGSSQPSGLLPLPAITQADESELSDEQHKGDALQEKLKSPGLKKPNSLYSRATLPLISGSGKGNVFAEWQKKSSEAPDRPKTLADVSVPAGEHYSAVDTVANAIPPELVTPILKLLMEAAAKNQLLINSAAIDSGKSLSSASSAKDSDSQKATSSQEPTEPKPPTKEADLAQRPTAVSNSPSLKAKANLISKKNGVEKAIKSAAVDDTPDSKGLDVLKPPQVKKSVVKTGAEAPDAEAFKSAETRNTVEPSTDKSSEPTLAKKKVVKKDSNQAKKTDAESPVANQNFSQYVIPKELEATAKATVDDSDLGECDICGRKFIRDRLEKHQVICKKNASKVRKVFDDEAMRKKGTEMESVPKGAVSKDAKREEPKKTDDWRSKRNNFINAIRAAKEVQAHVAAGGKASDLPPPPPTIDPSAKECPFCSRKFSENAYPRHVSVCERVQHRPSAVKPKKQK